MLTFHGVPVSVHVRKVIVVSRLKGLDHRIEPVVPFAPPEGWAQLSPTGLVPVMDDDGFRLPDSTAISLYLERRHPTPAVLPTDAQAYARALWFDAYAGGTLFRHVVHGLFGQKVIRPRLLNQPTDEAAVAAILETALPPVFGYLETQVDDGFLAGDALSLGDIAIASNLINFQYLGLAIDGALYPKLAAYARRMVETPALKAALEAERPVADQMGLDRGFLPPDSPLIPAFAGMSGRGG